MKIVIKKNNYFVIILLLTFFSMDSFSASVEKTTSEDPQSPEYRLNFFYKQRNMFLGGLDNLARNICLSSRVGTAQNIIAEIESGKGLDDLKFDFGRTQSEFNSKEQKFIFPYKESERAKTKILESLILKATGEGSQKVSAQAREYPNQFSGLYYQRRQCLLGETLENTCRLISGKATNKDERSLAKLIKSSSFIQKTFDLKRVCSTLDEKIKYLSVIKQNQKEIIALENSIKSNSSREAPAALDIVAVINSRSGEAAAEGLKCVTVGKHGEQDCTGPKGERYYCSMKAGKRHCTSSPDPREK